jgi:ATP-dependent Clp protease ATP-binding subunit ClpB
MRERVLDELRGHFRPEFLNRVDEIVVFHSLTEEELAQIVGLQVELLARRLAERRITIEVDESARRWLARTGYDPVYGARPLKRAIQREIETPLARLIVSGALLDGGLVRIEAGPSGLLLEARPTSVAGD